MALALNSETPKMSIWDIKKANYFVKIAVEKIVPEMDVVVNKSNNKVISAGGYAMESLKVIIEYFNFTYELIVSKERNFGSKKGGKWTGMVGLLQRREANLSMLMQINLARNRAIDFVHPDYYDEATFLVSAPLPLPTAIAIIKPFTPFVWAILLSMFPLLALTMNLISVNFGRGLRDSVFFCSFKEALWYQLGTLLYAGAKLTDHGRDSFRLVVFGWLILSLVVFATFSGQLVSFLNFPGHEEPIDTIEQLSKMIGKGKLVGGSIQKTFLHEALMVSKNSKIADLSESLKNDPVGTGANSVEDGLRRILIGKPRYAFCWGRYNTRIIASRFGIQRFHYVQDRLFTVFNGNGLPKNSILKHHFDSLIVHMREAGLLAKFYKDQTDRGRIVGMFNSSYNIWNIDHGPTALSAEDLQGAFLILGAGYIVSIVALFLEAFKNALSQNCKGKKFKK